MSGQRERIASGARFTDGVVTVMKDHVFGWVVVGEDVDTGTEEAFTVDELTDEVFERVCQRSDSAVFPEEFRQYLREFDRRTTRWRTRRLH